MATLKVPLDTAIEVLDERIEDGRQIARGAPGGWDDDLIADWKRAYDRWIDVTKAALEHVYLGDEEVRIFQDIVRYRARHVSESRESAHKGNVHAVVEGISKLESLRATLRFADASADEPTAPAAVVATEESAEQKQVFLVHGHDRRPARWRGSLSAHAETQRGSSSWMSGPTKGLRSSKSWSDTQETRGTP
jgi:hypothetical protein